MKSTKMQLINSQEEFEQAISDQFPSPEEITVELDKFHSLLYDALDESLVRTNEVVKGGHSKKAAIGIRPQLMRYFVHDFMGQKGIVTHLVDVNDENEKQEPEFEPKVLPGNGISGIIDGYPYRVLKKYPYGLGLPPAYSNKRKELYNQSHMKEYKPSLPGFATPKPLVILKPNLIYLWEVIRNRSVNLYLALPRNHELYATTELTFIPNPIMSIVPEKETTEVKRVTGQKSGK